MRQTPGQINSQVQVLNSIFPGMARRLSNHIVSTINGGIATFHRVADPMTPRDEGLLANNTSIKSAMPGRYEGEFTYNQHYGVYVHEGTKNMVARPWARNAARIVMPAYLARMRAVPWRG